MLGAFYKKHENDKIWWTENLDFKGRFLFSFDKKQIFNFFRDYPEKLTKEQKELFDKENPMLAELYAGKPMVEEDE